MKKIIAFLFVTLLATSFVACGGDTTPPEVTETPTVETPTADNSCLAENLAPGESAAQCEAYL